MRTLYSIISPICQPIAISRPSWRNRGALYTEYGVQIRCVRRDQSSSVGNLPPSPSLSSLPLPSSSPSPFRFPLRHPSFYPTLSTLTSSILHFILTPFPFSVTLPWHPNSLLHSIVKHLSTIQTILLLCRNMARLLSCNSIFPCEWVCDTLAKADDDRGDGRTECSVKTVSFFLRLSILTNSACKHSMNLTAHVHEKLQVYTHAVGSQTLVSWLDVLLKKSHT